MVVASLCSLLQPISVFVSYYLIGNAWVETVNTLGNIFNTFPHFTTCADLCLMIPPLTLGGEMEVLRSINWSLVKFDVLCIETDPPNRPLNYSEQVTDFLAGHGYVNHSGQQGRNICKYRSVSLL